jgi:cytochrome c553
LSEWYIVSQLKKFREGSRGTHFDDISGMRMRPMALTLPHDSDVDAIAKYVAVLPPTDPAPVLTGGDAAAGQVIYTPLCGTCHGLAGEGNQQLFAPPVVYQSDWYLMSQLVKFRAGTRGADPRDPIAIMMRPMSLTLTDQGMKDVIAYMMTLGK